MARWQDEAWRQDLRTLLDRRGVRLWALAERASDAADHPDGAETALVEALVRVFVAYRPVRPGDGAVRGAQAVVVIDDDAALDDLESAVADELTARPGGADAVPDEPDAARPAPSDVVASVEPRVAAERRRRTGRRRIVGVAAAGAGVALVAGLVWGAGYGPGHGSPVPTATVAEDSAAPAAMPAYPRRTTVVCGEHLDVRARSTGAITVALRTATARIAPGGLWTGTVSFAEGDVVRSHVALVGMPQIVVVGSHDGRVAAVGQGDLSLARTGSGTGRLLVDAALRFPACDAGGHLGPGTYRVVAVESYQDRADWPYGTVYTALSAPVTLTVTPADARTQAG
ncbi:hypothetical protein GCM10023221_20430 [Luteimicrobium xylanilyticum]|uniref:Uncharacterized protein n=1 Tax=Luteimicrobium xylanilyticum TaxID=1133546 RepID=A0A5P9Q6K4_9MICO|nr:hypothetical protein [Luteimicrobium xylanilyticum]QFU97023.1 hypothetical protein KDY119_00516 [Luteimicrobium xylanilyticum]